MTTTYVSVELVTVDCYRCGTVFGIDHNLHRRLRNDHSDFWCPSGHRQCYPQKSDEEKLRIQLANERERREFEAEQKEIARRQAAAARGQVTRIKNRVHNGVCPFCKRTFADVAKHMQSKHSDEEKETVG